MMIVIPCLNPNKSLTKLIKSLQEKAEDKIIIVDDGSSNNFNFDFLNNQNVKVLRKKKNIGKGGAIKFAIKYLIENKLKTDGIITVDCDGQHGINDIVNFQETIKNNKDSFIIGYRSVNKSIMPIKSYIGNSLSKILYNRILKYNFKDPQCGLRYIPFKMFSEILRIKENRYEFETICLKKVLEKKINIIQLGIETIYFNNNRNTHFKPIIDTMLILKSLI